MAGTQELWSPQPVATQMVDVLLEDLVGRAPWLKSFRERLRAETGTRLLDWVDHLAIPRELDWEGESIESRLAAAGFLPIEQSDRTLWRHAGALLPGIELTKDVFRVALKVDDVANFFVAHRLPPPETQSPVWAFRRQARLATVSQIEVWVVQRLGDDLWYEPPCSPSDVAAWCDWNDRVLLRDRGGEDWRHGFAVANDLIGEGVSLFGVDATCAAFFRAERAYWQARNRAGQLQKLRQDRLGLGWANHDHHTYRSSRVCFRDLVDSLTRLGFQRRERFYAGRDAGWGAQVLEQPKAGITVFADVDLSPAEVQGDFSSTGLEPANQLGTVGLWCALHGEAFLDAGMHHLECQFNFDAARSQLAELGVDSMPPFTNFDYLRQCFTAGERWAVEPSRLARLVAAGQLTAEQAERFRLEGVMGSHLEILERNDGFKGFNQTGISDIIQRTDPRRIQPL